MCVHEWVPTNDTRAIAAVLSSSELCVCVRTLVVVVVLTKQ